MRIAFIVNRYPPQVGGVEFHVHSLAHELSRQGHRVWVLNVAPQAAYRAEGAVQVLTGATSLQVAEVIDLPRLGSTTRIAQFLKAHQVELVSTHTRFFPMSLVGSRAARRAGIPVLHTEHGSGFVSAGSPLVSLGSRCVDLTVGRYVLSHAAKVLGVSPAATDFARRLGAPDPEVFYNAITPSSREAPPPDRPAHLVFVGRLVPGKGWDTFLQAVATLRSRGAAVQAQVLGDGPQLERARARAQQLGLDGLVRLRGRVTPEEVRTALAGATLVNPTVLAEGFQTTLLEALAERGRVVTFDVPGAEVLRQSGAPVAVCASPSVEHLVEALERLLADPPPTAPESLMRRWTWPVRAQEFVQAAQQCLAGHGG